MSKDWNYEGYKPLCGKDDSDDVPIMSRERNVPSGCYQDQWSQPCQSRTWNEEPTHEKPYDTFTHPNHNWDNVEAMEYNDYYSNVYAPYSSNLVFQYYSDDEEEENDVFTNYPHENEQVVLQELHNFEPEIKENADFENSTFEDSNEEKLEEVVEISVPPFFETVEMESEVESKLEEEPIMLQNDKHDDVLENQVNQKFDFLDLNEELYALLGLDNGELQEIGNDGIMTEAELLEIMEPKVEKSPFLKQENGELEEYDLSCSQKVSLTDFGTNSFSCGCEVELVKEPKPPDPFIPGCQDSLVKDVNESKVHMKLGICKESELSKSLESYVNLAKQSLLNNFEDMEVHGNMFLNIEIVEYTLKKCMVIWLRNILHEGFWFVGIVVWGMFYKNDKTKENILLCEYDWKGVSIVLTEPP